jgi:hypothetical protein
MIGFGAYSFSRLLAVPLMIGLYKFTVGFIYRGNFAGYVVMPLVDDLPQALLATLGGAVVIWLVESKRPVTWALVPATLYALLVLFGHRWMHPPDFLDRVSQAIDALFPALAYVLGGMLAARRRTTQHEAQITSG